MAANYIAFDVFHNYAHCFSLLLEIVHIGVGVHTMHRCTLVFKAHRLKTSSKTSTNRPPQESFAINERMRDFFVKGLQKHPLEGVFLVVSKGVRKTQ